MYNCRCTEDEVKGLLNTNNVTCVPLLVEEEISGGMKRQIKREAQRYGMISQKPSERFSAHQVSRASTYTPGVVRDAQSDERGSSKKKDPLVVRVETMLGFDDADHSDHHPPESHESHKFAA